MQASAKISRRSNICILLRQSELNPKAAALRFFAIGSLWTIRQREIEYRAIEAIVVEPTRAATPLAWAAINRARNKNRTATASANMASETKDYLSLDTWTANGSIERNLGFIDNLMIGRAALAEAIAQYPKARITLRRGAHPCSTHPGRDLAEKLRSATSHNFMPPLRS